MKNRTRMVILSVVLAAANAGWCRAGRDSGGFDLNSLTLADMADRLPRIGVPPGTAPAAGPAAPAEKEWTVMLYMCAKDNENNLEDYGAANINEMERAGSTDRMNIVVEFSRLRTGAKRYYVTQDSDRHAINSKAVAHIPEVNIGDWRHLTEFVSWAKANYPARKYMLVVWGHSNGWSKGNPVALEYVNKGIAYDDATGNNVDTPQLGKMLEITGGVDIFATDACLMQMAEVAYEMRDHAKYIVSSEGTTSSRGHPYYRVFSRLAAAPETQARELASAMVDAYRDEYGPNATLSALDANELPRLRVLADEFAVSLMSSGGRDLVKKAASKAKSFSREDRKDLYHFAEMAAEGIPSPEVREKARNLMDFIRGSLVLNSTGNVSPRSIANGVSVYLPVTKDSWTNWFAAPKSYDRNYDELKWAADGKWDEFVKWGLE